MPRPKVRTDSLRDEVLQRATSMLEAEGPDALRARHVASAAGTSTAALYELFGDKGGLVRAVFYEAFARLLGELERVDTSDHARTDLIALLRASRQFALDHPMLFELMYGRPFREFDPLPEDLAVASRIYEIIVGCTKRWLAANGSTTDAVDAAHALIALNRGLVASEIAGILGRSARSRDRRWLLAVVAQLDGLSSTG